jgi:hypothetical protein
MARMLIRPKQPRMPAPVRRSGPLGEVPVATGEQVSVEPQQGVSATGRHSANGVAARPAQRELALGEAVMPGGRISIAREVKPLPMTVPFTPVQLSRLDEALTLSTRTTGLDFSVYLGNLGTDTRKTAEDLHASLGEAATHSVLIAVSPGQRVLEIVTGDEAHRRLSDRGCKLATMGMVASFKESDLIGGLTSGLRMLTDQVGHAPKV